LPPSSEPTEGRRSLKVGEVIKLLEKTAGGRCKRKAITKTGVDNTLPLPVRLLLAHLERSGIVRMRLNPDAVTNTMHFLKCWGAGLSFSLIVVAGEAFALHTPFGFLAILFGIPLFILNAIAIGSHRYPDSVVYAQLAFFGSIFYGLLFYLISLVIRRISSKKPPAILRQTDIKDPKP
jgi:hypothetical protein